jgi:hypothetical protein
MTVTAPPRPRQPRDPLELQEIEALQALIEEARERARRRRRRYAATAVLLAILGVSLIIVFARPGPSENAAAGLPAPAGATDQDEAATVIAPYARMHTGWLLAYSDGRVIWQFETSPNTTDWFHKPLSPLFVRRLTPEGVDLVRSGAIQPSTLFDEAHISACLEGREVGVCATSPSALPAGTWADSEFSTYEPSRWALNPLSEPEMNRLPAAAQALVRGASRNTYNNISILYPEHLYPELNAAARLPVESLELTTAEASALQAAVVDLHPNWVFNHLFLFPILPHGEPVGVIG